MTVIPAEACVWSETWKPDFHVYGGRVCNTFMASSCSDRTPLHDAALHGRILQLKRLLFQGFNVDVVTLTGLTPLHEACLGGHFACSKLLIEHGADASAVSLDGATPLFNACCSGNPLLLDLLLKHCSVHHPAHRYISPIHEAARRGHTACIEMLLSHGDNIDKQVKGVGTPLYCACEAGNVECVQGLLLLGADVQAGKGLDTPLHAAVRARGVKEVELLLEHGAYGRSRNSEGKTPLELATDNMIKHLLQSRGLSSLSQLSRLCIRRTLGQKRLHRARVLYLPQILHNYLLYQ